MSDRSWMDAETRAEFEENRADLIENAKTYKLKLFVGGDDEVYIKNGPLSGFYRFYQDWRSEIEEML
ncbi:hypothetical protein SEA_PHILLYPHILLY_16 [Microbacterium phage PhillyPhilly]|nr:hypothetical protein SEA_PHILLYPHILLY_16 [Microbacterium phage PhillyPhilly]